MKHEDTGPAVLIQGLSKTYIQGEPVLRELSLSIARGEIHGIIGPNGSGKTTLLRLIAGYLEPDQGSVEIMGEDQPAIRSAGQRLMSSRAAHSAESASPPSR